MIRRAESNPRNARRSTGPRTPAGKLNSSRNALKHGLARSASGTNIHVKDIADALGGAGAAHIDSIAEATAQLGEIRHVQTKIIDGAVDDLRADVGDLEEPLVIALALAAVADQLGRLDRYERRAISRRKNAIRRMDRGTPKTNALVS